MDGTAQTLLGIRSLVHPSSGAAGNGDAGRQPIHFSLDGFLPSCYFCRSVATHLVTYGQSFGTFCPIGEGRRTRDGGFHNTPCLLLKSALCFRLTQPQTKPCFPAASNALALPGGNGIFRATPTERITHYTLLRKVVCQMGRCPLWKPPQQTGAMHPAGSIAPLC